MHNQATGRISFIEKLPSRNLLLSTAVITLGSAFQHGYYTACLNAPHDELKSWMANYLKIQGLSYFANSEIIIFFFWAIGTSLYFFGGAMGSLMAGSFIEKYDHTVVVVISLVLMIVPALIMVAAYMTGITLLFMAARIVIGIISGMFSCAVPLYLAEIAPKNIRGMICSWYMVVYAIGVCSAIVFGHPSSLGDDPWIIIMTIPLVPMTAQLALIRYCPVSPRFLLIKRSKYEDALKVLKWLRRTETLDALEKELEEIATELEDYFLYRAVRHVHWGQLFRLHYMRKPMLISIMMMCAQQICGINVFLLYSSAIFDEAGLPSFYGDIGTVIMGAIFVFMSILSMFLIEIAGRRMLFIYGYIGTFIFSFLHYMTYMYNKAKEDCVGAVAALFVWFFVVHYVLGPHSIPWLIVPEMFNQASRPKAMAIATFCNWTMNSVVAILFWPVREVLDAQVFLFFIVPQIFFLFLIMKYVPETTNKTITEITEMYK
ncbi:solute carrier family 2, facilitated glucose transporter member 3-like [Coccinella septempunctata]|uniref:solute carrier family 2, facilitated glucose transporter member 3-like n=1 Tax=Coccinella septempunctata TaxID=41139 RepID=UPI001D082C21|nr:solute carrier family 2, facilitated glucose transporter member 3-like [Coccinella septempunctata]